MSADHPFNRPFTLDPRIVQQIENDGIPRNYIDGFEQVEDGKLYKGQWYRNKRDGLGTQLWPDGSRYEGLWKDGKTYGQGRMTHANGDIYEGEW